MAWVNFSKTDGVDTYSAADINQLQENIRVISGNGNNQPGTTIQDLMSSYPTAIMGFTFSYTNTTTFGIAAGKCSDSTFAYNLDVSSAWSKTTGAWAAGTGNGALDTGSVDNSKTYWLWVIRKDSDGSKDYLLSLSATTPSMPAGYTYKRLLWAIRTNTSAQIIKMYQDGNTFKFDAQQNDRANAAIANTNRILVTVSAPEGCLGIFSVICQTVSTNNLYLIAQAVRCTDSAASATNYTHWCSLQWAVAGGEMNIYIDSNRQIAIRGTHTDLTCRIATLGWIVPWL